MRILRVRADVVARSGAVWVAVMLPLMVLSRPVGAEVSTMNITVRAKIVAACTLTTSTLDIGVPKGSTTPGFGVTNFIVGCPGATAGNPMPVRFAFTPNDGSGQFIMKNGPTKLLPYELCHGSACTQIYASGLPGPVVTVNNPTFTYALWGKAYPDAGGAKAGNYSQGVDVTLTY